MSTPHATIDLDERQLAQDFGISRTPVREAMAQLEREGFVRSVPRRGVYVVRKTKREVIEMITAWAALESMAARLITLTASDDEIAKLRSMFTTFENGQLHAKLDEYSQVNIEFHQSIIRMSENRVLIDLAENLFAHMRMIRRKTIGEDDRASRSIVPAISRPRISGGGRRPLSTFFTSVLAMPQAATRTRTSSGPIGGTGTVSTRMSFAPRYTAACMVEGSPRFGMGGRLYPNREVPGVAGRE
jgi:hypothetical protein